MTGPIHSDRSPGRQVPTTHGRAHKRALAAGIGASAALHVLLILLYSVVMTQWGPEEMIIAVESSSRTLTGMRVVQLVEIVPPTLTVRPPEEIVGPTVEIQPEFLGDGLPASDPFELGERPRTRRAADELRVRSSDARLWRQAMPEMFELNDVERMRLELNGRLEEWTDSVAEVLAAEYALTDWTTTDDQGRRWGISPGQLHLGDITVPLPFYFGGTALQREQLARRAWEDQDILNGVNGQLLRSSWRERADAIRRRKDRERNQDPDVASSDTTGTSRR